MSWVLLDRRSITLTPEAEPPPMGEWVLLGTRTITLTPPGIPPPPPPGEEEKKFPWALAFLGGGAIIAIAGLLSTGGK